MEQISNKTLAILLVMAIVISLTGTVISLNKIGRIRIANPEATGAATTGTGAVNLTISMTAAITLVNNTVFWGSGYVNGTTITSNCSLDTSTLVPERGRASTGGLGGGGCVDFSGNIDGIVLENSGNTDLIVYFNSSRNATEFLNNATDSEVKPKFMWKIANGEPGACKGILGPTAWVEMNNTNQTPLATICTQLDSGDSSDRLNISFNITFHRNISAGEHNTTLTIAAAAV